MVIEESSLSELAKVLEIERKRQKLSREEAASVCGVSASFIRDAESAPQNCSLGKLVRLIRGLGLSLDLVALPEARVDVA
jgi:HTH-type transcriptional regulator/antitoxin HipB